MIKEGKTGRSKTVRTAAFIALGGNLTLALLKIVVGLGTNSLAVLGDGIDSSTDVGIAIMALAVAWIINQPSDKEHPWGHGRAETIATVVLAFIIMLAGSQLVLSAGRRLVSGDALAVPGKGALAVTLVSIAGKFLLALSQFRLAKKSGSTIILANAKNMKTDIVISASVLAGLGASMLFHVPSLDPIVALLVGLWVMKNAMSIFLEQNQELMDGNADDELYRALFEAVKSVPGAGNPHRARIRKMAASWDIDLDIEVDGRKTVLQAHNIAEMVEKEIRRQIPDVYDIMVHVEPSGLGRHAEQYGLSATDLEEGKKPCKE